MLNNNTPGSVSLRLAAYPTNGIIDKPEAYTPTAILPAGDFGQKTGEKSTLENFTEKRIVLAM